MPSLYPAANCSIVERYTPTHLVKYSLAALDESFCKMRSVGVVAGQVYNSERKKTIGRQDCRCVTSGSGHPLLGWRVKASSQLSAIPLLEQCTLSTQALSQ
jgi:hypothetical protein